MKEYFLDGLIIKDKSNPQLEENTPLFHVTYLLKNNIFTHESVNQVLGFVKDGVVWNSRSHDNTTAVITYLAIAKSRAADEYLRKFCDGVIKSIEILPDNKHPRDFIYIAYLQDRWWFWIWLATPFIYPPALVLNPFVLLMGIFIWMAATKHKKDKWGRKLIKTDTEILYWIRLQLPSDYFLIHMTKWPTIPLLVLRFGFEWFEEIMDIYYEDENHPNRSDDD